MKLTNSNRTTVGVTRSTLKRLYSAKFDFRVDSIEDVIEKIATLSYAYLIKGRKSQILKNEYYIQRRSMHYGKKS